MPNFEYPDSYRNLNSIKANYWEGPYTSVANANASIPLDVREKGVLITIIDAGISKKYWYRDGLSDIDLVEFTSGTSGSSENSGGTEVSAGGLVTFTIGTTSFDVAATTGVIKDLTTTYQIDSLGAIGIALIAPTAPSTWVYIDNTGVIQQQTTEPVLEEFYSKLFLTRLATSSNVLVGQEALINESGQYTNQLRTVMSFLPSLNKGLLVTGNANKTFNISAGSILEKGISPNAVVKDVKTFAGQSPFSPFFYMKRDATTNASATEIDSVNYDNAGTLTAMTPNKYRVDTLYFFNSGNLVVQYGQNQYNSLDQAQNAISSRTFIENPSVANGTRRGWIVVKKDFTSLTNLSEVRIINDNGVINTLSTESGSLLAVNNLDDVIDKPQALINLGVTSILAKKENKIPNLTATFTGGLNATATSGLSLTVFPTVFLVVFANQNTTVGSPTLNIDGIGAYDLFDTRTNAAHLVNTIPNGKVMLCYTDIPYQRIYTTTLGPLHGQSYIDAQDLKSANAEGLFIFASTVDAGVTFSGTSTKTLAAMPRFFTLSISGAGAYTSTSVFNLGFGDYLLRDSNGDVIGITLSSFQFYSCYVDNVAGVIRILNFTNVNGVQTGTLSTNDYIVSKNFQRFPNEINIRVSAPNPSTATRASLIVASASPVFYDLLDQYGKAIYENTLETGKVYKGLFNSVTGKFEVQGVGYKALLNANYWLRNHFCGSGAIGIPYLTSAAITGGSIPNNVALKTAFSSSHTIRSSASGNSGYRHYTYNYGTSGAPMGGMSAHLYFNIPVIDVTTRSARFGYTDTIIIPSVHIHGFFVEISNLTISAKSIFASSVTTHATTYVMTKGQLYRVSIDVNTSVSSIKYSLFVFGNPTAVWSVDISTDIPTAITGMQWGISAINTASAVADIIDIYELAHGTTLGREKLG